MYSTGSVQIHCRYNNVISTLTVQSQADFSELSGRSEQLADRPGTGNSEGTARYCTHIFQVLHLHVRFEPCRSDNFSVWLKG